jgi:hypothetical protein
MSIPFIRQAQKSCGHCKQTGHQQPNCPKAKEDARILHLRLLNITSSEHDRREVHLALSLRNINLHDLCILMTFLCSVRMHNRLGRLLQLLVERNKMTAEEIKMRYKKDRIKALMWYYWYSRSSVRNAVQNSHKKLNITAKSFELETDLAEFECPICVDCKPAKEKTVTNCNHTVCNTCMVNYLEHQVTTLNLPKPRCSLCRADITSITFANTDSIEEISNKYFIVV